MITVDARTITPRKMVAQEINLMLNHCKKHGIPIIYVISVNQCIIQYELYIRWKYNYYLYYLHKNEQLKNTCYDRNINTIRLPVSINTSS